MSVTTETKTLTTVAQVDVKSAWLSKINWTQAVGGFAMALTFLTGGKVGMTPDQQLAMVSTIGFVQGVVTWVLKTFFTNSITPSVAAAPAIPTTEVMK